MLAQHLAPWNNDYSGEAIYREPEISNRAPTTPQGKLLGAPYHAQSLTYREEGSFDLAGQPGRQ